jgi:acyl-CoA thioesterase-1
MKIFVSCIYSYLILTAFSLGYTVNAEKKAAKPGPLTPIAEVEGLPHVLIIGDSISIGYTLPTRALLQGKVNLHRIPTNGGPTTKGLSEIDKWLGIRKWDLIHFNWGLHDLKFMGKDGTNLVPKEEGGIVQVPLPDYEKNLDLLVTRMKKSAKQLVWRNTTPIPAGSKARYVGDSVKYNQAAARIMKKHGVSTLDLYTPSKQNMKAWMRVADVHYFPAGSQALAEIVAEDIKKRLKIK